jgi:tryptophan synthase beta chain
MVTRFQSIISEEIRYQLKEKTGSELPTKLVACVGGGSNAAGTFYHYLDQESVQLIGVEASGLGVKTGETAATTFAGTEGILHGSKSLVMQTKEGQVIEPYSISAGLDYPGIGPLHAHLFKTQRAVFIDITDEDAMKAGIFLSRKEGIIPAIETAHAFAALDRLALHAEDVVVINCSGRGDKDLDTYIQWGKY